MGRQKFTKRYDKEGNSSWRKDYAVYLKSHLYTHFECKCGTTTIIDDMNSHNSNFSTCCGSEFDPSHYEPECPNCRKSVREKEITGWCDTDEYTSGKWVSKYSEEFITNFNKTIDEYKESLIKDGYEISYPDKNNALNMKFKKDNNKVVLDITINDDESFSIKRTMSLEETMTFLSCKSHDVDCEN